MKDRIFRLGREVLFVPAALFALAPAWAQESPAVKELLDRAQSRSQTEAVENLIRKLKGGDSRPSVPAAKPPEPPAAKVDAAPAPPPLPPPPTIASKPPPEPPSHAEPMPTQGPSLPPDVSAPAQREPAAQPTTASPADPNPPTPAVATEPPSSPAPVAAAPATPAPSAVAEPLPSVDLEVHFDYKSAAITPRAVDLLTTLGRALADVRLASQTFLIAGHTDARGGDAFNMKLSQARAEAVRAFLIRHFAIAPERLRTEGHGLRQLKNARNPYAGENRRVQVTNITPQTARP